MTDHSKRPYCAIVACGALLSEVRRILVERDWNADLYGVPAIHHMRPSKISAAVEDRLRQIGDRYDKVIVVYGDCGTAGDLDEVLNRYGVERTSGAHCYEIFSGAGFRAMNERSPTTYYLTDYLVRAWDEVVVKEMGMDSNPGLKTDLFGGFTSVTYLSQSADPVLLHEAERIAGYLGLPLEVTHVGTSELELQLDRLVSRPVEPNDT